MEETQWGLVGDNPDLTGDQVALMLALSQHVAAANEFDELLPRIAWIARSLIDAARLQVFMTEPDRLGYRCAWAVGDDSTDLINARYDVGVGVCGWVLRHGRAVVCGPSADPPSAHIPWASGDATQIAVPLSIKGTIVGVLLGTGRAADASFTRRDLRLLTVVATQTAIALDSAQMLAEERRLRARIGQLYRHSEAERHRAQATLLAIADSVIQTDLQGRVVYANTAARTLIGWTDGQIEGRAITALHHFTTLAGDAVAHPVMRAIDSGNTMTFAGTHTMVTENGGRLRVEGSVALLPDPFGGPRGAVMVLRDVTDQHVLQQKLQISQKMDSLGFIAGSIAHDFNNLLGVIMGNLHLLSLEPLPAHQSELVTDSTLAAQRGAELVRDMLSVSSNAEVHTKEQSLNAMARSIHQIGARVIAPMRVKLKLCDSDVSVDIDRGLVQDAVINLLINARDASPDSSQITLRTRVATMHADTAHGSTGRFAMIEVQDDGVGMAPEVAARIFEPFYTTKSIGKGTGLGLSTTYKHITAMGGTINVVSAPAQGSTFSLSFPCTVDGHAQAAPKDERQQDTLLEAPTVLVVDDERLIRRVLGRVIRSMGWNMIGAADAEQGVAALAAHPEVGIMLTDVSMPGTMDGMDLAGHCEQHFPKVRILVATGNANALAARHSSLEWATLAKPFTPDDLKAALTSLAD